MENPAKPSDLTNRGYTPRPTDPATLPQTRLDEAFRALNLELRTVGAPSLDWSIQAGHINTDDVIDVVVAAALRVLRNPEGVEEESGSIDDYRESRRRADATQDIYFTRAELRRLTGPDYTASAGSFAYTR